MGFMWNIRVDPGFVVSNMVENHPRRGMGEIHFHIRKIPLQRHASVTNRANLEACLHGLKASCLVEEYRIICRSVLLVPDSVDQVWAVVAAEPSYRCGMDQLAG